jgi:hypothetical protein
MLRPAIVALILSVGSSHAWSQRCGVTFSVVKQDVLKNVTQGLSKNDEKWFTKKLAKKYPDVCYAAPSTSVPFVFLIVVTPDTYHGTRVETETSQHSDPVSGTVTDDEGNTGRYDGTVTTTTTSSTPVPYSVDYGIYTLSIESKLADGTYRVHHRFQQKGLYTALYGFIPVGKGHQPVHAVIEDAVKWIHAGGLTDPRQSVAN